MENRNETAAQFSNLTERKTCVGEKSHEEETEAMKLFMKRTAKGRTVCNAQFSTDTVTQSMSTEYSTILRLKKIDEEVRNMFFTVGRFPEETDEKTDIFLTFLYRSVTAEVMRD